MAVIIIAGGGGGVTIAYGPPSGNACHFNFTTIGYVPPLGDAASFNFGVAADSYGVASNPVKKRGQIIGN